jgi:hypothetical protein
VENYYFCQRERERERERESESGKSDCRISAGALEITWRARGDVTKDAAGASAGDPYFVLTLQIARKIIARERDER